jgi:hypothetical protein
MGRRYTVSTDNVAISAVQDLMQVKGAAGKILKIRFCRFKNVDTTLPAGQMLRFRNRYLPATVTDGSGGSSPTPVPMDPGNAAASFTAKANDTTQASSSGTAVVLSPGGEHIQNGYERVWALGDEPVIGPSESFTFELESTTNGTIHGSTEVGVEEMGG